MEDKKIYLFNPETGCKIIAYWSDNWSKIGLVKIEKDCKVEFLLGADPVQRETLLSLIGIGGTHAPGFESVSYVFLASIPFIKEQMDVLGKKLGVIFD